MTVLLDTHILLWALAEPDRLTDSRRQLIEDRSNTVYASSVNAAEVAIKALDQRSWESIDTLPDAYAYPHAGE